MKIWHLKNNYTIDFYKDDNIIFSILYNDNAYSDKAVMIMNNELLKTYGIYIWSIIWFKRERIYLINLNRKRREFVHGNKIL